MRMSKLAAILCATAFAGASSIAVAEEPAENAKPAKQGAHKPSVTAKAEVGAGAVRGALPAKQNPSDKPERAKADQKKPAEARGAKPEASEGEADGANADKGLRGPKLARLEKLKKRLEERRQTRDERREKRRNELKKKWGDIVSTNVRARAELRRHSWRMARLNRIKALAEVDENTKIVERVEKLIEKEQQLHQKHMDKIAASSAKPGKAKALAKDSPKPAAAAKDKE